MEERLRGMVHLLNESDKDDIAFLDLAKTRFQNHILVTMSINGKLSNLTSGQEVPLRMIKVVELMEDIVSAETDDTLSPSVLLEVRIPPVINEYLLDRIFQLIDAIQRVALHFRLSDRVIKLFYVLSADSRN